MSDKNNSRATNVCHALLFCFGRYVHLCHFILYGSVVPFVRSIASDHFVPGFSTCHINLPIVFVPLSV